MSEFITGAGYLFEMDSDQLIDTPTDTPSFEDLNPIDVSKALNEAIATFFRLTDAGYAQNWLTAIDPQYDLTIALDPTDTLLIALQNADEDIVKRNRAVIQITDNFRTDDNTITADVTITAMSDTRQVDDVVQMAISFKFRGAPAVTTVP